MKKIILYRLTLREKNDGCWDLILRMDKGVKITEYNTLEKAMKEFNRALELRDMVNDQGNELVKWVKQRKKDETKK